MRTLLFVALGATLSVGNATAEPTPEAEVFFKFDSAALSDAAKTQLQTAASEAREVPGATIVLDAHADPRGTEPYNVKLSLRRAVSVRTFLVGQGIDRDRIVMAGYGEAGPGRDSYAHDRRVTVSLTADPLYSIIDGSKPYATTVMWSEPVTIAEIDGPPDKIPQTARR